MWRARIGASKGGQFPGPTGSCITLMVELNGEGPVDVPNDEMRTCPTSRSLQDHRWRVAMLLVMLSMQRLCYLCFAAVHCWVCVRGVLGPQWRGERAERSLTANVTGMARPSSPLSSESHRLPMHAPTPHLSSPTGRYRSCWQAVYGRARDKIVATWPRAAWVVSLGKMSPRRGHNLNN